MRDERPVVGDRCPELRAGVRELMSVIAAPVPTDLGSGWWAGDPELNLSLRPVAERLEACLERFDALQMALDLPAGQEPRYHRLREILDGDREDPAEPGRPGRLRAPGTAFDSRTRSRGGASPRSCSTASTPLNSRSEVPTRV
jgi:hypothetical protein